MSEASENFAARLPDPATVEAVLARLPASADDTALATALTQAFPGFSFSIARMDDHYWRDTGSVMRADGTRVAEYRPWMEAELAREHGNIDALWKRLRETDLQITEWQGNSVYAFAPTGPGVADYVQIALGREVEFRAGPIVNPSHRPWGKEELFDPSWTDHEGLSDDDVVTGPLYRLLKRAGSGVVHVRSFLARRARLERENREARRPGNGEPAWCGRSREMKRSRRRSSTSCPTGSTMCRGRTGSSRTGRNRVLPASACSHTGRSTFTTMTTKARARSGFVTRPLRLPAERLEAGEASVHVLMDRIEAIDREMGLPFAWFFLMTHGNRVSSEVGETIARGLREQRVVLPDRDARVLLRWAERSYGF